MEREGRMRGPEDWQKGYEGKRVVNAGAAPSVCAAQIVGYIRSQASSLFTTAKSV